jgi:hypothetical protein
MAASLRALARRLLGVRRDPTYYLPWLTLNGLECALILNNVEVRFKPGENQGPFPATVVQLDADGTIVGTSQVSVSDTEDTVELPMAPTASGYGFVTVSTEHLRSDLYVTLSDGGSYTATHGRFEFVETYPLRVRILLALLGRLLAPLGRTVPAFVRDQYAYAGRDGRSHLLLLNLSNVTNRVRVVVHRDGAPLTARLVAVPPRGARLLDIGTLAPAADGLTPLVLRLEGNAWFNLYLVGAGPRDLAGPLSLMHVK